ncbi:MAG: 2-phosphosulfolactate phosphatase [Verrucomicrobia subdivision 3 bacterium]|nr:2-phosphosulfolactate phosphatase [Limisphaerales bacterium]
MRLQTTFTPADFEALAQTDLSETTCVVFDILRATSSMVTALANGAERIRPVATIDEALAAKAEYPEALLCGERHGQRITAEQAKGTDFDLGNSPREYTAEIVTGKTLITTTTNGTRALRASLGAREVLVSSFLNLQATIDHLREASPKRLVLVCGGTFEEAALEDTLAAGALAETLDADADQCCDATTAARFLSNSAPIEETILNAQNAKRLLSLPDLAEDVSFCLQRDTQKFIAVLAADGMIRQIVQ